MRSGLVWRGAKVDHAKHITRLLSKATGFDCAVAFAKPSGLALIKDALKGFLQRGGRARFIIGLDFCVTHPDALADIHALTKQYCVELYALTGDGGYAFHPKMYHFTFVDGSATLIGSANLTKGGLTEKGNYECSILLTDQYATALKGHLDALIRDEELEPFDETDIQEYRDRYTIAQIAKATEKRQFRRLSNARRGVDRLEVLLEAFKADKSDVGLAAQARDRPIRGAQSLRLMRRIVTAPSRAAAMRPLVDALAESFSSRIVPIHFAKIARQASSFKTVVSIALDSEQADASEAYGRMRAIGVTGIGVNWVSEMLQAVNPARFAVLNNNSIYGMSLATDEFPTGGDVSPDRYGRFCETARTLAARLGLANVRELDALFSHIYFSDAD